MTKRQERSSDLPTTGATASTWMGCAAKRRPAVRAGAAPRPTAVPRRTTSPLFNPCRIEFVT
jgi:hypothetical protein